MHRVGDGLKGHARRFEARAHVSITSQYAGEIANGVANVAISGELDLSNAARLDAVLREVERVDDVKRIWLDMRGLEFIDWTGVSVMCDAIDRARRDSDRLRLTGTPSPTVRRLLELAGIGDRLPTEWRALRLLGGAAFLESESAAPDFHPEPT